MMKKNKGWFIALLVVCAFSFPLFALFSSPGINIFVPMRGPVTLGALSDLIAPYTMQIILLCGINVILASSLNLVNGFTGQFSMGHAGFMSVGAYTSAVITTVFYPELFQGPMGTYLFFIPLLSGGIAAGFMGYVVGLPSLRLRGDYLAIVTLGFGEIIRVIAQSWDLVGASRGLPGIPPLVGFAWVYGSVVLTLFCLWRLVYSRYGRGFIAVREDEIAAEAMGVPTTKVKVRAFMIGAFFAGVAGGLFAHLVRIITPAIFDFNKSFEIIILVVFGGMGSLSGSVIAAIFLTLLKEQLRGLQAYTYYDLRMVIYSFLLILLMIFRPGGLLGRYELYDFYKTWRGKFLKRKVTT